jgi:hypothetical protein
MRSLLIFLVITFLTLNASAQLGDLFRKLGDAVDSIAKKNKNDETVPKESENKIQNSTDVKPTTDNQTNESSQHIKSNTETNSVNQSNKNASITSQEIDIRGFRIGMSINEALSNIKKTIPINEGLEECKISNLGAIDSPELFLNGDQYIFCTRFKFFNKTIFGFGLFFIDAKLVFIKIPIYEFDIDGDWTKDLMVPDYYIALNEKFAVSPPFFQGDVKDKLNSDWEYNSSFSDKNGSTLQIDGYCRIKRNGVKCKENFIRLYTVDYVKTAEARQVKINDLKKLYNEKIKEKNKSEL